MKNTIKNQVLSYILLPVMILFCLHTAFAYKLEHPEPGTILIQHLKSNIQHHGFSIRENPFKYSGYYSDVESSNYYLNARYYSSALKRFISRDTYDLANRYTYCGGSPFENVDPAGHKMHGLANNMFTILSCAPVIGSSAALVQGLVNRDYIEAGIGAIGFLTEGVSAVAAKCVAPTIRRSNRVAPEIENCIELPEIARSNRMSTSVPSEVENRVALPEFDLDMPVNCISFGNTNMPLLRIGNQYKTGELLERDKAGLALWQNFNYIPIQDITPDTYFACAKKYKFVIYLDSDRNTLVAKALEMRPDRYTPHSVFFCQTGIAYESTDSLSSHSSSVLFAGWFTRGFYGDIHIDAVSGHYETPFNTFHCFTKNNLFDVFFGTKYRSYHYCDRIPGVS